MSQAITRCPECQTSFRITEAQLLAAEGTVRCGACMNVFQAEDYLVSPMLDVTELLAIEQDYWLDFERYLEQVRGDAGSDIQEPAPLQQAPDLPGGLPHLIQFTEPVETSESPDFVKSVDAGDIGIWDPAAPEAEGWAPDPEYLRNTGSIIQYWSPVPSDPVVRFWSPPNQDAHSALQDEKLSGPEPVDESSAGDAESSSEYPLPDEVLQSDFGSSVDLSQLDIQPDVSELVVDRRNLWSFTGLKWVPGILLMLVIGACQFAFFSMDRYAQDPRFRAYYEQLCGYVPCEVPVFNSPDDLQSRELVVRSHPEAEQALAVDLLLRNSADYRQLFPRLRLRFFDLDGQVVGSRIFEVREYLGGELRGLKYIPARTEVRVSLELVDPGEEATGYEMDVLPL